MIQTLFMTIIIFLILLYCDKPIEGFYSPWNLFYTSTKYCSECNTQSRYSCNNCINCGYCINNRGLGECVVGDESGPYFRDDCIYYEYGKQQNRYGSYFNPFYNPFYYDYLYPTVSYPRLNYLRRHFGSTNKRNRQHKRNFHKNH